jgi:dTDP-4-dehydrorhamnose 3,5-epimerase
MGLLHLFPLLGRCHPVNSSYDQNSYKRVLKREKGLGNLGGLHLIMRADFFSTIHTARDALALGLQMPAGVKLRQLTAHKDDRGCFTEIFRNSWGLGAAPVQWNIVRSEANVLRGVHVHRKHADYLLMAVGEMVLILHDVRAGSSMRGVTTLLKLQADDLHLVVIPVGVAHGFYFSAEACHIYSVTHDFDGTDELGCHWQEADLGINGLCDRPKLSARDANAGSYAQMINALQA